MSLTSPEERRLILHANRRREVNCLTAAWFRQQPFGREVAREVRRLYKIPREVAVLGWLLAGGELLCRALLLLLSKLPLPTVVHNLFRGLDEATCGGLQWVETTRQAARRGERCPVWRRAVGALLAAGVAPSSVLWGRWHSRQQRLFLQEAGVLCPPSGDSQPDVLWTAADIILEIMAEISSAFLGRAATENHHLAVAQEPALDTVAEEDEEGCYEYDNDPDTEEEDTIPLWEQCWPDDVQVMGRTTEDLPNNEMKLTITNDIDKLHDSNSNKKLTSDRAVSNEYSGATCTEDAKRLSSKHQRSYNNEMDGALTSSGELFATSLPIPPLAFTTHSSARTLPWPPVVEGSAFTSQGQDPAWDILFDMYCSLLRMMLLIPLLLMKVMRPDQHHEENGQRAWSSVRPDQARTRDEEEGSPLVEPDEHCEEQWNDVQPQHSWKKTYKGDQRRRTSLSSSSCDEVWEKETSGIEPKRSSEGRTNRPIKSRVVTGGKKNRHSISKKVSQETCDFIEPGLSDYEEEMWLQLGTTPQKSKKEDEEIDVKQTDENYFETWLNEESEEKFEDIPNDNYLDEMDIRHNRDNVEFENSVRSKAYINAQFSTGMSQEFTDCNITTASMSEKNNVTTKFSEQLNNGRGSDEDAEAQNSACESNKKSLNRSFTYILRTKSDNHDSFSFPEASINMFSENGRKAVKNQTNCKTCTDLLNANNGSEILLSDFKHTADSEILSSNFKHTADVTNRSTQSKTAPPKVIQRGAKIGKPVTRKLQTKSNLSSGRDFPPKLQDKQFRRTDNLLHKSSPLKPIGKLNPLKLKTNTSGTSGSNILCSSGTIRSGISAPILNSLASGNQAQRPAKTRMNGSIVEEKIMSKLNKPKILDKCNSSDSKIPSCIEQQKDHKTWRSCCMNSQTIYKEAVV